MTEVFAKLNLISHCDEVSEKCHDSAVYKIGPVTQHQASKTIHHSSNPGSYCKSRLVL